MRSPANLDEQLTTLRSLAIGYLDLRGAWGKNVLIWMMMT